MSLFMSLPLVSWAELPVDTSPATPPIPTEGMIYDLLIKTLPTYQDAQEFFRRGDQDASYRLRIEEVITTSAYLKKKAQEGSRFRARYIEQTLRHLNPEDSDWLIDPFAAVVKDYQDYLDLSPRERPLKQHESRQRALQEMGLPSELTDLQLNALPGIKDRLARLQFRIETLETKPERRANHQPENFERWKSQALFQLERIRIANWRQFFNLMAELGAPDLKLIPGSDGNRSTKRLSFISLAEGGIELGQLQDPDSAARVRPVWTHRLSQIKRGLINGLNGFWSKFSSFTGFPMRGNLNRNYDDSEQAKDRVILFDQEDPVDLSSLLTASYKILWTRDSAKGSEKTVLLRYLEDVVVRDSHLVETIATLKKVGKPQSLAIQMDQTREQFASQTEHWSMGQVLLVEGNGGPEQKYWSGLRWFGHQFGRFWWWSRDAETYSERSLTERPKRRLLPPLSALFRRLDRFRQRAHKFSESTKAALALTTRPITLAAALLVAVQTGAEVADRINPNLDTSGLTQDLQSWRDHIDEYLGGFLQDIGIRTKNSTPARQELGFHSGPKNHPASIFDQPIRHYKINRHSKKFDTLSLPKYFDYPLYKQIFPQIGRDIRVVRIERNRRSADIEYESVIPPRYDGDRNRYPLLVPRGFIPLSVWIWGKKNGESKLKKVDVYHVEGTRNYFFKSDLEILEIEIEATQDPSFYSQPSIPKFNYLDLSKLEFIHSDLRNAGFVELADELLNLIADARAGGAPIGIYDLDRLVAQYMNYSYRPARKHPPKGVSPENIFYQHSRFAFDGQGFAQCNLSLAQAMLEFVFAEDPSVQVDTQVMLVRAKGALDIVSPGHQETIIRDLDSGAEAILSDTPLREDPENWKNESSDDQETPSKPFSWLDLLLPPGVLREENLNLRIVEGGKLHPSLAQSLGVKLGEVTEGQKIAPRWWTVVDQLRNKLLIATEKSQLNIRLRDAIRFPPLRVLRISFLIRQYAQGEFLSEDFFSELESLYPGVPEVKDLASLQNFLQTVYLLEKELFRKFNLAKSEGRIDSQYEALAHTGLQGATLDLIRQLSQIEWTKMGSIWTAHQCRQVFIPVTKNHQF